MRTVVDDKLMKGSLKGTGLKTKRDVVEPGFGPQVDPVPLGLNQAFLWERL